MFFAFSIICSRLCLRTNETLRECSKDTIQLNSSSEINNYTKESIYLEVISSEKYAATFEEISPEIQSLEVVGYDSFVSFDITNHHIFKSFSISNCTFTFTTKNYQKPVEFYSYKAEDCHYELKHISINTNIFVGDLEAYAAFLSVQVTQILYISCLHPKFAVINLNNSNCEAFFYAFNQDSELFSRDDSILLRFGQENVIMTNVKPKITFLHDTQNYTISYTQQSNKNSDNIILSLSDHSKLVVNEPTGDFTNFPTIQTPGESTIEFKTTKKSINLQVFNSCEIKGEFANINKLSLETNGVLTFTYGSVESGIPRCFVDEISFISDGKIRSDDDLILNVNKITLDNINTNEQIISSSITVSGYPDFVVEKSSVHIGKIDISSAQKFIFNVDFINETTVVFDEITSFTNSFVIYLNYDLKERNPEDMVKGKTFNLITMPCHFNQKQNFILLSNVSGYSQDFSLLKPVVNNNDFGTFGVVLTEFPENSDLSFCFGSCSQGTQIQSIEELKPLIENASRVTIFFENDQEIKFDILTKPIELRILSENTQKPNIKFPLTENLNSFVSKITFSGVNIEFIPTDSAGALHVPYIKFEDESLFNHSAISFCDDIIIEIPAKYYKSYKELVLVHLVLEESATITLSKSNLKISNFNFEISYEQDVAFVCKHGITVTVALNSVQDFSVPLKLYGEDFILNFEGEGSQNIGQSIAHCYAKNVITVQTGNIPVSFLSDLTNLVLSGNKQTTITPQHLEGVNMVIGTKSNPEIELVSLNLDSSSSITGPGNYSCEISDLVTHSDTDATIMNMNFPEIQLILDGKLTFINSYLRNTNISIAKSINSSEIGLDISKNSVFPKRIDFDLTISAEYLKEHGQEFTAIVPLVAGGFAKSVFVHLKIPEESSLYFSSKVYENNNNIYANITASKEKPITVPPTTEISSSTVFVPTEKFTATPSSTLKYGRIAIGVLGLFVCVALIILILIFCFKKFSRKFSQKVDNSMLVDEGMNDALAGDYEGEIL
ncbi:hypothetical protein TVAG_029680 [Trichomonas vaginalis G3]|uniref:Uncharacterized protein n=1 Tax=Trichomonas vaginalis (strain ATCC PRA-98 / G3) TaxID=412133 RepID=A2FKK2_TRIV3|nr:uncharacterized protein TVAGG3_1077370 [Trichomonas vaginalis G3]EAX94575.1 hypothetical protein TVAG_029680 [Trichomonas vaginalis G3]KAI5482780.1 hypothetical protein TVAGG3_1077370 [Trichomonas vaginalis G3]|eukprot:XP_001307505.1 hypothetical protein [Trichomonas vaginalis G3]